MFAVTVFGILILGERERESVRLVTSSQVRRIEFVYTNERIANENGYCGQTRLLSSCFSSYSLVRPRTRVTRASVTLSIFDYLSGSMCSEVEVWSDVERCAETRCVWQDDVDGKHGKRTRISEIVFRFEWVNSTFSDHQKHWKFSKMSRDSQKQRNNRKRSRTS